MKNNLYKAALLAALGLAGITTAQASNSDFLLGFNDAAGPTAAQNDYVIDLGSATSLYNAAASNGGTVNLWNSTIGGLFTTAFSADGNYDNNVAVGLVEGNTPSSGTQFLYQTINGNPSTPATISGTELLGSAAYAQGVSVGESASGAAGTWSYQVAPSPVSQGLVAANGDTVAATTAQPLSYLASGTVTETLYENTLSGSGRSATVGGWTVAGSITVNPDADIIDITIVPEPSTYALLALGGLLVLSFRHRINRINA
jgi:hypothetical protein